MILAHLNNIMQTIHNEIKICKRKKKNHYFVRTTFCEGRILAEYFQSLHFLHNIIQHIGIM